MMKVVLVTFALVGLATAKVSYEGYKVFKVLARTEVDNEYLASLESNPEYDFWSVINKVGNPVSIMASPKVKDEFEAHLKENQVDYAVEIDDVEAAFEEERTYHRAKQSLKAGRVAFDRYLSHNEINAYLDDLASRYPTRVTVESVGRSYQNRSMNLIRIASASGNRRRQIIVDAGIHAREWIAPAMAVYLINQLVENAAANSDLPQNLDWIILPVVNPDGYEYSRNRERLWRKTLSPGTICTGCDGNRNFDYHWMEAGASSWECSETYAGRIAFSEIETRNLRDFILKESNVEAYLTLHSYGNYFLYPWGYAAVLPDNWQELDTLGRDAANAIRAVAGTRYTVGSSTLVLYAAAGASDDWAMGVANIPIVYTVELPGGGIYGFDLPATRILPVGIETFEGFKVLANYVANR